MILSVSEREHIVFFWVMAGVCVCEPVCVCGCMCVTMCVGLSVSMDVALRLTSVPERPKKLARELTCF